MNGGNEDDTKRTKAFGDPNKAPLRTPPHNINKNAKTKSSPAFDLWLERQLKLMFLAQETPPDMRLLDLLREAHSDGKDKITK